MIRFLFFTLTLVIGVFLQVVFGRYLSLYDAAPQVFLLLTVAHGFVFGPLIGEVLGFSWGLISDASGVRMFGMNSLLLALAGFMAGLMRRRVASERFTAQLVISLMASLYYTIGVAALFAIFDETPSRFSTLHFMLEMIFNALFMSAAFLLTERWAGIWNIPQEHM